MIVIWKHASLVRRPCTLNNFNLILSKFRISRSASIACVCIVISAYCLIVASAQCFAKEETAKDKETEKFGEQLLLKLSEPPPPSNHSNDKTGTGLAPAKSSILMKGTVLHNEVVDTFERLGILCAIRQKSTGDQLVVHKIRQGSPAYYGGLAEDDLIESLYGRSNSLYLNIKRNGKPYQIGLKTGKLELDDRQLQQFITQIRSQKHQTPVIAHAEDNAPVEVERLVPYDVELFLQLNGVTINGARITWLKKQIGAVIDAVSKNGGTVAVTAADGKSNKPFTVKQCTRSQFDRLLSSTKPSSNFAQVLHDRLKLIPAARANNNRPLLVTVIHDGSFDVIPNKTTINGALTNFARDLKPRTDVDLAFLNLSDTASRSLHGIIDLQKSGVIAHVLNTETYAAAKHAGIQNSLLSTTAIGAEAHSSNTFKSVDSSGIDNATSATNKSSSSSSNSSNEQTPDTTKAPNSLQTTSEQVTQIRQTVPDFVGNREPGKSSSTTLLEPNGPSVPGNQNQPTPNVNVVPSVRSSDSNSGATSNTNLPSTAPTLEQESKEPKEPPTSTGNASTH